MTTSKTGGLVYPPALIIAGGSHNTINAPTDEGLTIRDYFAGLAMQALLSANHPWGGKSDEAIPKAAYRYADLMLVERERGR